MDGRHATSTLVQLTPRRTHSPRKNLSTWLGAFLRAFVKKNAQINAQLHFDAHSIPELQSGRHAQRIPGARPKYARPGHRNLW